MPVHRRRNDPDPAQRRGGADPRPAPLRRVALAVVPIVGVLLTAGACGDKPAGCTNITVTTQDANGVKLAGPPADAVLHARVTDDGTHQGVAGLTATLTLSSALTTLSSSQVTTDAAGDIAFPLTGLDPRSALNVQQASSFDVSFPGDGTYCGAEDTSTISVAG